MSGRKLGGGRILGSGKGLAPPAPPAHQRMSSLGSPSESTVSLSSRESAASPLATSPFADGMQDLSSRVSMESRGARTVTAASSKLICPICNEEMVGCFHCLEGLRLTGYR
jgi:rabenosyn-5